MVIREYGTENKKHLVFFQGSCEPWQEFRPAAEGLASEFHVLLVTPDGHDPEEHNDFISVEKTVDDTASWLKEHRIDHLDANLQLFRECHSSCFILNKQKNVLQY